MLPIQMIKQLLFINIYAFIYLFSNNILSQNIYQWEEEPRIVDTSYVEFIGELKSGSLVAFSDVDYSFYLSDDEGEHWQNLGKLPKQKPRLENLIESISGDTIFCFTQQNAKEITLIDKKFKKISTFYTSPLLIKRIFRTTNDNLLVFSGTDISFTRITLLNDQGQVIKTDEDILKNNFFDDIIAFPLANGKSLLINNDDDNLSIIDHDLKISLDKKLIQKELYTMNNTYVNLDGDIYMLIDGKIQVSKDSGTTFTMIEGQENIPNHVGTLFVNERENKIGISRGNQYYYYHIDLNYWTFTQITTSQYELKSIGESILSNDYRNIYIGDSLNNPIKTISLYFGAINTGSFQVFEDDFLLINGKYFFDKGTKIPCKYYHSKLLYMNDGSLQVGSDSIYISSNRARSFVGYKPHFYNQGLLTKDLKDKLYYFDQTFYYGSIDNGITWQKEDGNRYFPQFDVDKGDIQVHHSDNFFARAGSTNLYRYEANGDNPSLFLKGDYVNEYFYQFAVLPDMTVVCFKENKNTKKQTLYRVSLSNLTYQPEITSTVFPFRPMNAKFITDIEGIIYVHNQNTIYASKDKGTTWLNITGDLPQDIEINNLDVGVDKTIYLACKGSNIRKSKFKLFIQNQLALNTFRTNNICDTLNFDKPTTSVQYKIDSETYVGNSIGGTTYLYLDENSNGKEVEILNYNVDVFSPCSSVKKIIYNNLPLALNFHLKETKSCSDLNVQVSSPFLRRCFTVPIFGKVVNNGSVKDENCYVILSLDSLLNLQSSSHNYEKIDDYTIKINLGEIDAQEIKYFNILVYVDCQADFNELICFDAKVYGNLTCKPSIEKDSICIFPIGSYDPNDIQAFANNKNTSNYIEKNDQLKYKIRFQNVGTDTAFNIFIIDTLPNELDFLSIRPQASSHPFSWELNKNILFIKFDNIQLPDSSRNEILSNGFIDFDVQMTANVSIGDIINNFADIYFDFNLPVRTNVSSLILRRPVSTYNELSSNIEIYPNPVMDELKILLLEPLSIKKIQIIDIQGKVVRNKSNFVIMTDKTISTATHELIPGLYFLKILEVNGRMSYKKFIKI